MFVSFLFSFLLNSSMLSLTTPWIRGKSVVRTRSQSRSGKGDSCDLKHTLRPLLATHFPGPHSNLNDDSSKETRAYAGQQSHEGTRKMQKTFISEIKARLKKFTKSKTQHRKFDSIKNLKNSTAKISRNKVKEKKSSRNLGNMNEMHKYS